MKALVVIKEAIYCGKIKAEDLNEPRFSVTVGNMLLATYPPPLNMSATV